MPGSAGAQLSLAIGKMSLRRESLPLLPLAGLKSAATTLSPFRALSPRNWTSARDTLHKGSLWVLDPFISTEMAP